MIDPPRLGNRVTLKSANTADIVLTDRILGDRIIEQRFMRHRIDPGKPDDHQLGDLFLRSERSEHAVYPGVSGKCGGSLGIGAGKARRHEQQQQSEFSHFGVNCTQNKPELPDIIHLLPDNIANQIAAGEVIQRPASAVKELLENAVDSGATDIRLFIQDAGKSLIQVVDNGKGMSDTDARMAFERHATSKIRNIDDLFHIKTMGFRGEALASIAAVAQVELRTRREEDEMGTCVEIENSRVIQQEPVAMT